MSPVISADVPDDVADRVEESRQQKGDGKESRSKAVNRLLRAGLEQQDRPPGVHVPIRSAVGLSGALIAGIGFDVLTFSLAESAGYVGLALLLGAVAHYLLTTYTDVLDGINLSPARSDTE